MKKLLSIICIIAMTLTMLVSCNDHVHTFSTGKWAFDSDYHWNPCIEADGCKEKFAKEAHTFAPSVDNNGNAVNKCTVCGATNDKISTAPEHECSFSDTYQHSENFHWFPCTQEGCYEMIGKAEHAYGNPEVTYADGKIITKYTCVDCGYESVTEEKVDTVIDNAVAWNEMFKNFKLTNFTMKVYLTDNEGTRVNHCIVTNDAAYYHIEKGDEFYTLKNADGTCATYYRYNDEDFRKLDDTSDGFLVGAQTETVIQVSFEENFEKFTYDSASASYVCTEEIECTYYNFDGTVSGTLICYDSVVKITDGKISYIEAKYYQSGDSRDDYQYSFIYYNIGISEVTIPQNIIDNALPDDGSTGL